MTKQELDKFENALKEQGYELSYQIQIESESYSYYKSFKSYLVFFLIYDFSNTLGERIPKNVLYAITPHIIYGDMDGQRIDLAVTANVYPEMISKFENFAQQFHNFLQSQKKDKLHNEPKNYVERLQHEIAELGERIARLEAFMSDSCYKELPHKKQILLEHQYDVMHEYHDCLTARLELETASPE